MNDVSNTEMQSMSDAILEHLRDSGNESTLLDLEYLETEFGGDVWADVFALIFAGRVFVSVPLSELDWDTTVMLVTWEVGCTSPDDIEQEFREPHAIVRADEGTVLLYDLYVRNVSDGYPPPSAPYSVRDAEHEVRPNGCTFPFAPIWPPEALQIEFVFDRAGTLAQYEFKVGERVS